MTEVLPLPRDAYLDMLETFLLLECLRVHYKAETQSDRD